MKPTITKLKSIIQPGDKWRCTQHRRREHEWIPIWDAAPRPIVSKNSVGFTLGDSNRPSHLDWPKAKELTFLSTERFIIEKHGIRLDYSKAS